MKGLLCYAQMSHATLKKIRQKYYNKVAAMKKKKNRAIVILLSLTRVLSMFLALSIKYLSGPYKIYG